ncbi:hypothetical protein U3516DRAFT_860587 [Neocallimastix sp. 'constans']
MKLFLPYVDRLYIITTNDTFTISNLENALIDRIPVIPSAKRFYFKSLLEVVERRRQNDKACKDLFLKYTHVTYQ